MRYQLVSIVKREMVCKSDTPGSFYLQAARSEELDKLEKEIQQTKLQCEEEDSVTSDDNMTECKNES